MDFSWITCLCGGAGITMIALPMYKGDDLCGGGSISHLDPKMLYHVSVLTLVIMLVTRPEICIVHICLCFYM